MAFNSNRYTLQEQIGRGGMGVVYAAFDRLTGERVALKQVVLPSTQTTLSHVPLTVALKNLRLALAHEFRTLASLRHPHIISVLDYGFDHNRQPYFTMSYLQDAQTILAAGQNQSAAQRVQFIQEMLEALAYLHRRGILHRDMKPENVLVSNGTVRVLDFGLASAVEEAHESVGTWQYTAPEILLEQPATKAADLYSVGVLAFQLFAGKHPFNIYDPDFIDQILYEPPDFSQLEADEAITAVIAKLLAKEPKNRYPSAEATIAAFSAAMNLPIPRESASIRESYLQAARFVGRQQELTTLNEALENAENGQGIGWLLGGESGVGKSRLVNEVQTQALVNGFLVLRGQGIEEGGRPYELWIDGLRRLILQQDLDDLAAGVLQSIIPDIDQLLGRTIPAPPILHGNAARQRLFSTISQLFQQTHQPILLILEDLQWTQESLALLAYLSRQIAQAPILIIGSYRDDERPDLPQQLPHMQIMHLARLGQQEMATLSVSMLGQAGQQPEVLDLLQRETEGNAFFLVEVVRTLAEEAGRLSAISSADLPKKLFPRGIETIIERRLTRVPERAKPLLTGAAVLGRQLDLSLLSELAATHSNDLELDDWLNLCADAAIFDVDNGRWQFAHDKLREGILNHLSNDERIKWHQQAAETIETVYTDAPEHAGALVYHWRLVGDESKEQTFARIAGEHARRQFLNSEAITYLSRALTLTKAERIGQRYTLLESREQIYHLQGEREAQLQDIQSLQKLAEAMVAANMDDKRVEAALRQANYAEATADYPTAVSAARAALQLANTAENVAASQLSLGRVFMRQGNYDKARENFNLSLATAQENNLPKIEADNHRFLGLAALELSQYEQSRIHSERALPLYKQVSDRQGESTVLNNLAIVTYSLGDLGEATTFWEQAQKIYDAIGDQEGRGRILTNLSSLYLDLGDYVASKHYSQEALKICREINVRFGECLNLINLGLTAHYTADVREARQYGNEAREVATEIGSSLLQGYALTDSGFILTHQGRLKEATAFYNQAMELWQSLDQEARLLETRAGLAQVALVQRDLATAQQHIMPVAEHLLGEQPTVDGAGRPFHIYLVAYQVLDALNDARGVTILEKAYNLLQKRAAHISDAEKRQSFLQKVPAHALIIQAHARA